MERLRARTRPIREWYLDLRLLADYYEGAHRYHHTAPISNFYGLFAALQLIEEEGLEKRWERHYKMHQAFVKGVEALGLKMHVPEAHRIWNLNTPQVPAGVDDAMVRKTLLTGDGIEISGGFGPLAGKIFRVGTMGPLATPEKIDFFLDRFSHALAAAGYAVPAGAR
jgi:alanine-glyoxylate transaminase/serine-glyoxylate transaminase/serine-pyruvate transaminase